MNLLGRLGHMLSEAEKDRWQPDTEKELCILNDVFCFVSNKGFQERRGAPCEERKGSRRWGGGKGEEARMSRDPSSWWPWGLPTYF